MKIHEYQAKEVLSLFGVPIPRGKMATTVEQAVEIAKSLDTLPVVVKAQIHAGGRGKGGGVKLAKSLDEVKARAGEILGMMLKTHQTGPEGQKVRRIFIEEGVAITDLRPGGTIRIGKDRYDALAEGRVIEAGRRVRVVGFETGQVKVRAV